MGISGTGNYCKKAFCQAAKPFSCFRKYTFNDPHACCRIFFLIFQNKNLSCSSIIFQLFFKAMLGSEMAWIWKDFFQVFNLSAKINDEPGQAGTQFFFYSQSMKKNNVKGPFAGSWSQQKDSSCFPRLCMKPSERAQCQTCLPGSRSIFPVFILFCAFEWLKGKKYTYFNCK